MSEHVHDEYGKKVLRTAAGPLCRTDGPSVVTDYGGSSAHIDGTVGSTVAVEVESRTGKQVRGAVLDLILHAYPKKLLILIPKYIGPHQQSECEFILNQFIDRDNFRVVLLEGTGHNPNYEPDTAQVKQALTELSCSSNAATGGGESEVPKRMEAAQVKEVPGLYWVYENYPNNKAVGHSQGCVFFKKWGGNALATGRWHGPFDTRQAAQSAGQATGRPLHWCPRC